MAPKILRPTNETGHGHFYLYGFVALLVLVLLRYLYQTFTSPLRRVPGPLLARFTRLWEAWAIRKFDNPTLNLELHEKYGESSIFLDWKGGGANEDRSYCSSGAESVQHQ
jgi:hypothetical protein